MAMLASNHSPKQQEGGIHPLPSSTPYPMKVQLSETYSQSAASRESGKKMELGLSSSGMHIGKMMEYISSIENLIKGYIRKKNLPPCLLYSQFPSHRQPLYLVYFQRDFIHMQANNVPFSPFLQNRFFKAWIHRQ